jgi:hypothetical protein
METAFPTLCPQRKRLLDIRSGLVRLHMTLILAELVTYERINGRVASSSTLLQLVASDPWFTWLHPFPLLVHRIDQLLEDDSEFWLVEGESILKIVRFVIRLSDEGDGFARSYYEALQREPEVVVAHMELIILLTFAKVADPQPVAIVAVAPKTSR